MVYSTTRAAGSARPCGGGSSATCRPGVIVRRVPCGSCRRCSATSGSTLTPTRSLKPSSTPCTPKAPLNRTPRRHRFGARERAKRCRRGVRWDLWAGSGDAGASGQSPDWRPQPAHGHPRRGGSDQAEEHKTVGPHRVHPVQAFALELLRPYLLLVPVLPETARLKLGPALVEGLRRRAHPRSPGSVADHLQRLKPEKGHRLA